MSEYLRVTSEYLRVTEVAKILRMSRRSVQYLLVVGKLEGVRIGPRGWWWVKREAVLKLFVK
jgi:excisionase family DNA binding protein